MPGVTKRMKTKKTPETIKKEFLESILKVFEEENYLQICEEAKYAKDLKDSIFLIKKYEDLLKSSNKKIINIVAALESIFKQELRKNNNKLSTSKVSLIWKVNIVKTVSIYEIFT